MSCSIGFVNILKIWVGLDGLRGLGWIVMSRSIGFVNILILGWVGRVVTSCWIGFVNFYKIWVGLDRYVLLDWVC